MVGFILEGRVLIACLETSVPMFCFGTDENCEERTIFQDTGPYPHS